MKTPIPSPGLSVTTGSLQKEKSSTTTTTKFFEHNRSNTCVECHMLFDCARYDAEFCSTRCRMRRQRKMERIETLLHQSIQAIEALATYHRHAGHDRAFEVVSRIATRAASVRDNWES